MNYQSISNIEAQKPHRITTGDPELDWLYGISCFTDDNGEYGHNEHGMPVKTISTWCGEGGVGKSRLAIKVAKYKVQNGSTVLYFQNEVDLATLASWVNDDQLKGFYCSEVTALNEQVKIIEELKPDMVFVDSINLVDEYGTGTFKSIKKIIDAYRKVIRGTNCHVVILCQLNKEGSATGSTALGHLPDTNLALTNYEDNFKVSIGKKNRYGPKGSKYFGVWKHLTDTVKCISNNRYAFVRDAIPNTESDSAVVLDPPPEDGPVLKPFLKSAVVLDPPPGSKMVQDRLRLVPNEPVEPIEPKYDIWNPEVPYGNWGLLGRIISNIFRK